MDVEVDASGKVELRQQQDMSVAFSNNEQGSILIPRDVKEQALHAYRRHTQGRRKPAVVRALLFAILVYLLLRDHITQLQRVTIDREYPGYEDLIRDHILNLFRRKGIDIERERIIVGKIEPDSLVDKLAWQVSHHRIAPDRVITLADIVAEF